MRPHRHRPRDRPSEVDDKRRLPEHIFIMMDEGVSVVRRLGLIITSALLSVAGVSIPAAPAQGTPPDCQYTHGHSEVAGQFIYAWALWACQSGNDIDKPVDIQRYLSPGVYETVASGVGSTTYYCTGSLYNVYRTTGEADFGIVCS